MSPSAIRLAVQTSSISVRGCPEDRRPRVTFPAISLETVRLKDRRHHATDCMKPSVVLLNDPTHGESVLYALYRLKLIQPDVISCTK